MAKFVVLDPSLQDQDGHHFSYAVEMLRAAGRAGFEPILVANERFDRAHLPERWETHSLLPQRSYVPYSLTFRQPEFEARLAAKHPIPWRQRLRPWWKREGEFRNQREYVVGRQADAFAEYFRSCPVEPGDHLFMPSANEFDMACILRCLRARADRHVGTWHAQFHFPFLTGRPPGYRSQRSMKRAMHWQLTRDLATYDARFLFYATCEQLAQQYRLLKLETEALPYALPRLTPRNHGTDQAPLRVVCAGGLRDEKGYAELDGLVRDLWADGFGTGKLQLLLQTGSTEFSVRLPEVPPTGLDPIVQLDYPLPAADYRKLIEEAHVGLFLYDSTAYYARFSAGLGDKLSAGVPVIVPAGCWLSEAISEAVYAHVDTLAPGGSGTTVAVPPRGPCRLERPAEAELAVFGGRWSAKPGRFLEVEILEEDADGRQIDLQRRILGARASGAPVRLAVLLDRRTARIIFSWRQAYANASARLADATVCFPAGGRQPTSAVGLIAAEPRDAARQLREMIEFYPHYRATAGAFAGPWAERHNGDAVIRALLARSQRASSQAAVGKSKLRTERRRARRPEA